MATESAKAAVQAGIDAAKNDVSEIAKYLPGGELLRKTAQESSAKSNDQQNGDRQSADDAGDGGDGEDDENASDDDASGSEDNANDEDGADDDADQDSDHAESPNIQKRIDKLTAQRKSAEEALAAEKTRAAELEQQLKTLQEQRNPKPVPTANDPLADVTSVADLQERIAEAERAEQWALQNLDGATVKTDDGERELTAAEVRRYLASATAVLRAAPKRLALLQAQATDEQAAMERAPELFKPGTEANQQYQEIMRMFPELNRFPDHKSFLADWYAGKTAREKASKAGTAKADAAAGKTKKPVQIAPPLPGAKVAPRVSATAVKQQQTQDELLSKGGSPEALEKYFLARG